MFTINIYEQYFLLQVETTAEDQVLAVAVAAGEEGAMVVAVAVMAMETRAGASVGDTMMATTTEVPLPVSISCSILC